MRQRGSHVVLRKETRGVAVGTVVPLHEELRVGTLKGILELARISEEDFAREL